MASNSAPFQKKNLPVRVGWYVHSSYIDKTVVMQRLRSDLLLVRSKTLKLD